MNLIVRILNRQLYQRKSQQDKKSAEGFTKVHPAKIVSWLTCHEQHFKLVQVFKLPPRTMDLLSYHINRVMMSLLIRNWFSWMSGSWKKTDRTSLVSFYGIYQPTVCLDSWVAKDQLWSAIHPSRHTAKYVHINNWRSQYGSDLVSHPTP